MGTVFAAPIPTACENGLHPPLNEAAFHLQHGGVEEMRRGEGIEIGITDVMPSMRRSRFYVALPRGDAVVARYERAK
jgi:hypothetical protein